MTIATRVTPAPARPAGMLDDLGALLRLVATLGIGVALWAVSLGSFDMARINDLGLISLAPPYMLIGIALLGLGFVLALRLHPEGATVALVPTLLLLVAVHGLPTFIEEVPRGSVAYLHSGFTEEIATTGNLLTNVDARFSWPVFFSLGALVTSVAGIGNAIELQAWAAPVLNAVYLVPLFVIYTSLTVDRRLVWTAIFLFIATNWIGQDYYSPQGFNYLLYLTVLAILLRWFRVRRLPAGVTRLVATIERRMPFLRTPTEHEDGPMDAADGAGAPTRVQRAALVACVVLLMAVSVASHQLTPFALLAAVTTLTVLRRISLPGLPVLMAVLIGLWISYMTVAYLEGHLASLLNDVGAAGRSASENVTRRLSGSPGHLFVVQARLVMTLALWLLAFAGAVRRFRVGHLDVEAIALAAIPFGLMLLQAYGGEMLLRVYLFGLPFVAFLAAGAFFPVADRPMSRPSTATLGAVAVIFAVALMLTKHGNERADYISADELATVDRLYALAPSGSTLGTVSAASPLGYRRFGEYDYVRLYGQFLFGDADDVLAAFEPVDGCAYLLLSRTQQASAEMYEGVPLSQWLEAERGLLETGRFTVVEQSRDATILVVQPAPAGCGAG